MILLVAQKGIVPFEGSVVAEFFQDEGCLNGVNFLFIFWDQMRFCKRKLHVLKIVTFVYSKMKILYQYWLEHSNNHIL